MSSPPQRNSGPPRSADAVVVGAGIVGAACAYHLARAGLRVVAVDSGSVASGTTGAGEGNLLVSDKNPGPELDLMQRSLDLWRELGALLGDDAIELERKGGLMVAADDAEWDGVRALAERQRECGVDTADVDAADLPEFEPHLASDLLGGVFYPQDLQVQPMLATAHLLRLAARDHGVAVHTGVRVTAIVRAADGRVVAVETSAGRVATETVVNAAGTWAGEVAGLAGVRLAIEPRRGFILVTEPLPSIVRHKVYASAYVANVASDASDLQSSAVVEGTRSGTILIGASRERVGFDRTLALPVLRRLATQAVALFPILAGVHAIRAYGGFRPYSPDHLPVIGPDPRVPGLVHACGHEGAGIGLAPATGELVAAAVTGSAAVVDAVPFRPERFPKGAL